jgi:hypothetical protein
LPILALAIWTNAAHTEEPLKIRVLGIGNSFTRNATRYLTDICKSDPKVNAEIAMAYIGGSPLDYHARLGQLAETNPDDPKARKYKYVLDTKWTQEYYTLIEILKSQSWDYVPPKNFDPSKMVYPAKLPDESTSLHSGFHWSTNKKTGTKKVTMDGFHASHNGEYLGGLVWYEFFFGGDARQVTYIPSKIPAAQAKSLQQAAHATMKLKNWRSPAPLEAP